MTKANCVHDYKLSNGRHDRSFHLIDCFYLNMWAKPGLDSLCFIALTSNKTKITVTFLLTFDVGSAGNFSHTQTTFRGSNKEKCCSFT